MATIDVNIPDSALEAMAEKIAPHVEGRVNAVYRTTDKFEDLEVMVQDIESRFDDLEQSVEEIQADECVSRDEFNDLETRVDDLESANNLEARVESLEEAHVHPDYLNNLIVRVSDLEKRLEDFAAAIRSATDRINHITL
jgi:chromosome segregation ATPase